MTNPLNGQHKWTTQIDPVCGKYQDTNYRKCNLNNVTQEHILQIYAAIHTNEISKININDIFSDDKYNNERKQTIHQIPNSVVVTNTSH